MPCQCPKCQLEAVLEGVGGLDCNRVDHWLRWQEEIRPELIAQRIDRPDEYLELFESVIHAKEWEARAAS